jgi:hypothetical protein
MPERFPLRRAVSADAAAVRTLTRTAYAKWVPLIGREPLPMTADYDRAVAEHIIDLWEKDGQLLALIESIPEANHLLIEKYRGTPRPTGKKGSATSFCVMPKRSHVPWVSMRPVSTRMLRLLRTCRSIAGADTRNIEERQWCRAV